MGITNAQIAKHLEQATEATAANTAAFTHAVEKLIENDNRHHDEFRRTIQALTLQQAVDCKRTDQHERNWDRFWKVIAAAFLIPICIAVLQLVL